ncbi:MAG: anaerobic sulfatase-maturation protein [Prevotellaceae bacterium]|nr:anaerobic sulfatase-maturation protein [Prevotellaceae bacterium]
MNKTVLFNPLSMPMYVMAKPVGATCNLNCAYCYYLEKEKLYPNRTEIRMSDGLLEKYIESYINAQPVPHVLFTWHGGETLLAGLPFYRKALALQKKHGKGRVIANSLQTNGVLLNDEWCRFFRENQFLIGISIDGPEHCHNMYRQNAGGNGTFRQVMRGIELLQKHRVDFNILSVINNYNVRFPLDVYRFFKAIGAHYMQFLPVVERIHHNRSDGLRLLPPKKATDAPMAPWAVGAEAFGRFYIAIFDEWVRNDIGRYFVQLFDAVLANFVGEMPGSCILAPTCGHASVMEWNGDVYSCDHFVFPEYKLGNIRNRTIVEMMFSEAQLRFGADKRDRLPQQCVECEYLKICNGECPKNRVSTDRYGNEGLNYLCEGYKMFFKHAIPCMKLMAKALNLKK